MKRRHFLAYSLALLVCGCATIQGAPASPPTPTLIVMTSGGFAEAMDRLEPQFERRIGRPITVVKGSSAGGAPDSIPERLKRGERADLIILSREGLELLERDGRVMPGSARDLVRSQIGMAVRRGAKVPDISTPERFRAVLLAAPSIGYSASASGTYLATDLWPRLGLAEQLLPKSKRVVSERVGSVVARGEVAIGFQQMSELLPIRGITVVGKIPAPYQKVTVFTAAKTAQGARNPVSEKLLVFLTSKQVSRQVAATGLEPIADD